MFSWEYFHQYCQIIAKRAYLLLLGQAFSCMYNVQLLMASVGVPTSEPPWCFLEELKYKDFFPLSPSHDSLITEPSHLTQADA